MLDELNEHELNEKSYILIWNNKNSKFLGASGNRGDKLLSYKKKKWPIAINNLPHLIY